jgi:hypothetical protein
MRIRERRIIFAILFSINLICTIFSCRKNDYNPKILNDEDFSINEFQIESLTDIGKVDKVIIPEATDDSLFAYANQVKVNQSGDIYILDKYSQSALYHFDYDGKFINKYGTLGQGPGEYQSLAAFDFDQNKQIYLLSANKLLKYNSKGEILNEKELRFFAGDMEVIRNEIFLYVLRDRSKGFRNNALIYVFNEKLENTDEFGVYDKNLMKYLYTPTKFLAAGNKSLFYLECYDLCFYNYSLDKKNVTKIQFDNKNKSLENIWDNSRLNESDRTKIKRQINRFDVILSIGEKYIVLQESWREKGHFKIWIVDLEKKSIRKFSYFKLINSSLEPQNYLTFDYIAGSYSDGLILVIDDSQRFAKYKDQIEALRNIQLELDDNPLIVFLKID